MNKKEKNAYNKKWREEHPEYHKKWNKEHPEQVSKYAKQWHEEHPEYNKQWREDNPDYDSEYWKKWSAKKWMEDPQYMIDKYEILRTYGDNEAHHNAIMPEELEHARKICKQIREEEMIKC